MLSIIAIFILSVSGQSPPSDSPDLNHYNGPSHFHQLHNSPSQSSDNNGQQSNGNKGSWAGKPYHPNDFLNNIKKGQNLHQIEVPYKNHPYANAVKKTKSQVLEELKTKDIPSELKDIMDPIFGTNQNKPRSLLTDAEAEPIRITANYDSSVTSLSSANEKYLKETVSAAINYLERSTQVIPVSGAFYFDRCNSWWTSNGYRKCANYQTTSYCQNSPVPEEHYGDLKLYTTSGYTYSTIPGGVGVQDTDLVLYISYYNTQSCQYGALAHAGPCAYDQYGRPVAGNLNVCQSFFNSLSWESDAQTMLHEITHITIMVSSLWDSFRDPSTGGTLDFYDDVYEYDGNIKTGVIKSPIVKQMAQDHFGCTSNALKGYPLTNTSSHWHTKWSALETMNPTAYGPKVSFSKFTFGLMEDSGWYYVDYEYAQPYYFGENVGCGIFTQDCINLANGNARYDFCDTQNEGGCLTDYSSQGYCFFYNYQEIPTDFQYFSQSTSGGPDDSDYCPFRFPYSNTNKCVDKDGNGLNSRCTKRSDGSGDCFPHNCINGGVEITVNSQTITCLDADAGSTKTVTGDTNIICPEVDRICGDSNANAFNCYNGHYSTVYNQCMCNPGYKGTTCNEQDDDNASENEVSLAASRAPTLAPTDPPECVTVSGFGSYANKFAGDWQKDTVDPVYNGKGVYYINVGTGQSGNDRRIWWNAFNSEYVITRTVGSGSTYCKCFGGSEDYPLSACNGNWQCYQSGGYQPIAAGTMSYCGATPEPTTPPPTPQPTNPPPTPQPVTPAPTLPDATPAPVTPAPVTPSPITPQPTTPNPTPQPTTLRPTLDPTPEPAVYCESVKSSNHVRQPITAWTAADEATVGQDYLVEEIDDYMSTRGACIGDSSTVDYYYRFIFRKNKQKLVIKLDVCCHASDYNAIFDSNTYTPPNNYQHGGSGTAFTGDDKIIDTSDGIGTKEIIVFVIIGIIALICIIGTIYIGKRMYDKKQQSKADEVQLTLPGNIKNTITPIDDNNDENFPNTTR